MDMPNNRSRVFDEMGSIDLPVSVKLALAEASGA